MNYTEPTTPTPLSLIEAQWTANHRGLRSSLGAGGCQMCGASPCVCAQLVDVPAGAEWWIGEDGRVVVKGRL